MITIRPATENDAKLILDLITELAVFEKARDEVVTTEAEIRSSLLASTASPKALIVELEGVPVGYAVYFYNYSTWLGKPGLYLEDLYISQSHRGTGAGKALLKHLAQQAVAQGCGRMEWSVLDWNTPAIEFYEAMGAKAQSEWTVYRLAGKALSSFAAA